jgi:nitrite reductase/ring-hydroxylating ferredoxin subunit
MSKSRQQHSKVSDYESADRVITEIKGMEIAVFQKDGTFHAMANYCTHQGGPLCEGGITKPSELGDDGWEWEYDEERSCVVCPWHGWRYDIESGENVDHENIRSPTYDVEVEDGSVYVLR